MARGSASRSGSGNPNAKLMRKMSSNAQTDEEVQGKIERQWQSLPTQARPFLLETPLESLDLRRFAKFWSSPELVGYTRGAGTAGDVRDASYCLALNYLKLGKAQKAHAIMLNGSFIMECMDSTIETIVQWCLKDANPPEARLFSHALERKAPQAMDAFLQRMLRMFCGSSKKAVVDLLGRTGGDSGHSTKRRSPSSMSEEKQIQLIIADDEITRERHVLNIGSSTTLKKLFTDYAEKRGVSLRLLRFSYKGKMLFLSSAGNRTPDELNMEDQDVVTVHDTSNDVSSSRSPTKKKKAAPKHMKRNSTKKTKGNTKKKRVERAENIKTLEEYKADHSTLLSKLHEEVQPRLKGIRTMLNALDLERQPPKKKRAKKKKAEAYEERQMILPGLGVSGKAGKPCFIVQVGEVQNLYKTAKSSRRVSSAAYTLDLHGCSRDEALAKLDESLASWADAAMRGTYPFVIPARIVCGCGGQVISETVERWIRDRAQVANCPKGMYDQ